MSLPNTSFHSDSNFESAVQDLEQEKKMVAALKRLSIGHMMQYDPDLPPGSMDDIDPFANNNNNSNTASNNNHYNGHTKDHTSNNNNTHNHSPNSKLNHHRGQSPYDEDLIPQNIHRSHSTRSRSKSHSTSPSTSPQHKPQQQQQPQPFHMNHRLLHITNHQAQSRDVVLRQFQRVDVRKSRYFSMPRMKFMIVHPLCCGYQLTLILK